MAYELKQTLKQEQLNAATAEGSSAEKAEEGLTETPVRNGSDTTEERWRDVCVDSTFPRRCVGCGKFRPQKELLRLSILPGPAGGST